MPTIVSVPNDLRFLNVGEAPPHPGPEWTHSRQWEACIKYCFISAGQGIAYSRQLLSIEFDDVIAAYITGQGYVGLGKVTKKAVKIKDFEFEGKTLKDLNIDKRILNGTLISYDWVDGLPFLRKGLFQNANNEKTEYAIGVEWLETVDRGNACWKRNFGLFAKPHIQCKLKGQSRTLEFLETCFDVKFNYE